MISNENKNINFQDIRPSLDLSLNWMREKEKEKEKEKEREIKRR